MSLRIKVLLSLSLVFLVGGFWAYRTVYDNIRPQFLRVMEDGMVDQTYLLAQFTQAELPLKPTPQDFKRLSILSIMKKVQRVQIKARIYEWQRTSFDYRIYITDHKGIVRLDTDNGRDVGKDYSKWNDVYRSLRGSYGARSSREFDSYGTMQNSLYTSFPLLKKGKVVGVLSLVKSKESLAGWASLAQAKLWKGVLIGASVLFVLAILLTQVTLRPIYQLTQYAKDIAAGRRTDPPSTSNDEIGTLTQAFIEMKHALWQRRDIEEFVTQLTHELKSPICAIQGAAELLEDPSMPTEDRAYFLNNVLEQSKRMDDIVQRLLRLVALEQREQLDHKKDISLGTLLQKLEGRFASQAANKQITLSVEPAPNQMHTEPKGDPFLLEQALTNLLQNSFHFTPEQGSISLQVKLDKDPEREDGKALFFEVLDTGPGIPDYATERVMEKFYSLEHPDSGKKGTGLGLPFVQQVALLHGGGFSICNRDTAGAKASMWIELPRV
jgi:two-component system sensor histidine kinase CreC